MANSSTKTEQGGVHVSADKTVRVNARIAGTAAAAAAEETYVITRKAPAVDVGSTRLGPTFDSAFNTNVPIGRNFGDVIEKAPGAFVDRTGSVSIGGATGLENVYLVDGLNVTGVGVRQHQQQLARAWAAASNFPVEFLDQMSVNTGGYSAEFGGAMGGVVNAVTKSGSNDLHGSVVRLLVARTSWPAIPKVVTRVERRDLVGDQARLRHQRRRRGRRRDHQEQALLLGRLRAAPAGGPRLPLHARAAAAGRQRQSTAPAPRSTAAVSSESRQTYHFGAKLDFVPAPDHRLTLSIFGSPSSGEGVRAGVGGDVAVADPAGCAKPSFAIPPTSACTGSPSSSTASGRSRANIGVHREYFNDYSPNPALNNRNQEEWWGANLWDRSVSPGCEPQTVNGQVFQPCPVDNYHNGGFGLDKAFTTNRLSGDLKSTHIFEAGGHHELKYGWHFEGTQFDQDRYYSGPLGDAGWFDTSTTGGTLRASLDVLLAEGNEQPYQFNSHRYDLLGALTIRMTSGQRQQLHQRVLPAGQLLAAAQPDDQRRRSLRDAEDVRQPERRVPAPAELLRRASAWCGIRPTTAVQGLHAFRPVLRNHPDGLAARYFGGEGILVARSAPASCTNDPLNWTGGPGEWRTCTPDMNPGL